MCYHLDMVELRSHWSSEDSGESGSAEESLETRVAVLAVPVTCVAGSADGLAVCYWVQSC